MEKEFVLEGLDCANCAGKIENELNKIDNVEATVNFITKTLNIKINAYDNIDDILKQADAIIHEHEPHIIIKEKKIQKKLNETYMLGGLCCSDCCAKLQKQVSDLLNVKKAVVDFNNKKLILEFYDDRQAKNTIHEVMQVARQVMPDIKIIQAQQTDKEALKSGKENSVITTQKKEFLRLAIGAILFVIGIVLKAEDIVKFFIFFGSYIIAGSHVLLKAARNITKGKVFDENFLMSVATIGAFAVGQSAEGAAVMLFYKVGEIFENAAVNRSRNSIRALMDIRPDYATIETQKGQKSVAAQDVSIGTEIIVKAGERVPLDGIVQKGISYIDTSALTGESVPRQVKAGDEILSASINKNSVLTIKTTKEFNNSTVSKIIDLVQNAANRKAHTENFITKFARVYTPAVVFAAVAIAFIPPVFIPGASLANWVYRALIFLVISCPCALVISIPLGFFGGIGAASKNGILIKGSNYLEALNYADMVVFDKTGTLTKGAFKVVEILPANGYSKEELIETAAYAESYSNHPIAESILSFYGKETDKSKIESYEEVSGQGIIVHIGGQKVFAGNEKLLSRQRIDHTKVEKTGTVIYIAKDDAYLGAVVISDEVKADAAEAIRLLKETGIKKTVMLSGDRVCAAKEVAEQLGIDEVYAQLLPDDKVKKLEYFQALKSKKEKIIFVGDGINDAPALARADISIAMGALGSDAAIEAADIVIMTDELAKISQAMMIAKRTKKIVWQNIIFALGIKGIFLMLGALGLATMWEAVFADVGVTLIAVVNAMRAMKVKKF